MAKLIGKNVGEPIVEYLGPITERNFNINGGSPAPTVTVQVFGAGEVELQETQTSLIKGNAGLNVFTNDTLPDPTTWAPVGTVNAASGPTVLNVTPDDLFSAIRAVVTVVGDGKVVIQSNWR